jgi:hypothetical protein
MRLPSADLRALFAGTQMTVLPGDYVVAYVPLTSKQLPAEWFHPATTRFLVVIREEDRFVLVMPRAKWLKMQMLFDTSEVEGPLRVIALDANSTKFVPGYLTQLGAVMTAEKIRTFPISSFRRNHLMVQKPDLPRTVKLLRELIEQCKAAMK